MECGIGITACSLPPLRLLFKNFFKGSTDQSKEQSAGAYNSNNYNSTNDVSRDLDVQCLQVYACC